MKTIFSLYGGPGTGKSSSSAGAFSLIKNLGVNAEHIQEHVKMKYAWKGIKPKPVNQFSIFGEQTGMEYDLVGPNGPDVILTDSPIWLQAYYAKCFGSFDMQLGFERLAREFYRLMADEGVHHVHLWLKRLKPYNEKGRFQTEKEAIIIDQTMLHYLSSLGVEFDFCDGTTQAVTDYVMTYLERQKPLFAGGCY